VNTVYWVSMIIMWAVSLGACTDWWIQRRKLRAATEDLTRTAAQGALDAPLADWCRHTHLTVVTHTGTDFTVRLAELQADEQVTGRSAFRTWNVPVSITVWSDTDEEAVADVSRIVASGKPFPSDNPFLRGKLSG